MTSTGNQSEMVSKTVATQVIRAEIIIYCLSFGGDIWRILHHNPQKSQLPGTPGFREHRCTGLRARK